MENWPFNPADLAVFGVLLISALLAFARGLLKELLSVAGWVGAAFATLHGLPILEPYAVQVITIPFLAKAVTGGLIFVVTLVVLSLISHIITGRIKDSMLSALDRSLGFIFGVLRGAVLVCLAYLVLVWAVPPKEQPQMLLEARTKPLIDMGADMLRRLVPETKRAESAAAANQLKRQGAAVLDAQRAVERLTNTQISKPDSAANRTAEDTGYDTRERKDLDRLIQSTQ